VAPRCSILILGAGPTGLGAARRLEQLGFSDWALLEASRRPGGLASSFLDDKGFTWDIGGHVQFSHYPYFDEAMDEFLGKDGWIEHDRESWVWMRDRFIPYPLQNNIHRLPPEDLDRCLQGLLEITHSPRPDPRNFGEWIDATFGAGIADIFLRPYNFKVWAYPPELLSASWVGERVAAVDFGRILRNVAHQRDDLSWGPNSRFRFPLQGGTGAIWEACASRLPAGKLRFGSRAISIDLAERTVETSANETWRYDRLLSTIPLTELLRISGQTQFTDLSRDALLHSSSNIVGMGLAGAPPPKLRTKCWIYFPEDNCPFYRATVFSNYSPRNVPDPTRHWSLMFEVSESPLKPVNQQTLVEDVIAGALNTRLIAARESIVSTWTFRAAHGYPTPAVSRDAALGEILPFFESKDVQSRGRFGAWKYEVSNQDHSFMQGVEAIDRLQSGAQEITVTHPNIVNGKKR
jgi:protoporphyrinogen oxidase